MDVLTPAERRAVMVVVVLLLLGAAHDLWRSLHLGETGPPFSRDETVVGAEGGAEEARPITGDQAAAAPRVRPGAPPGSTTGPPAGRDTTRVDLNRASVAELDGLPGLGPVLAKRIIEHRQREGPFRSFEELRAVRGIGPRLLDRLRPRLTLGDPQR